jgi:two-component system nitrogen regulation response regulator NtrX
LPPLRSRAEDLPALVDHFARQVSAQNGWKPIPIAGEAIEALKQYPWPGNVRELRNVVERLLLLAEDEVDAAAVELALPAGHSRKIHFHTDRAETGIAMGDSAALAERVLQFERAEVLNELERHNRNVSQTAKALGLERSHLYKKCQQLGIDLKRE